MEDFPCLLDDANSSDGESTSLEWQEYFSQSQLQDKTDALPCHTHLPVYMLVNHWHSQQNSKEEYKPWKWGATARYYTSHTKIMLPMKKLVRTMTIVKMQTAVVWSCLLFIRSGQNHLARHSERGKKTRQMVEEVRRQHQGVDRPEVCQVPENWEK